MKKTLVALVLTLILSFVFVFSALATSLPSSKAIESFESKTAAAEWAKAAKVSVKADKGSLLGVKGFGLYPTRKGVILVTADTFLGLPLGHAAIIYSSSKVVEAISSGVKYGYNNWNTTKKTVTGVTLYATSATQDAHAADWCSWQLNKPYNYNYFNIKTRSSFYCSQLVYASFLDNYKIDLNTSTYSVPLLGNPIHPSELVNNSKTYAIYKK